MGIIHHSLISFPAANSLESAGNASVFRKPSRNGFQRHTQRNACTCRPQCVIYAETPRCMQLDWQPLSLPEQFKGTTLRRNLDIFRSQCRITLYAKGQDFAAASPCHIFPGRVIHIDDTLFRAFKKQSLCCAVVFHRFMVIQMVLCQIGKNRCIKRNAVHPAEVQRMGGNLHHYIHYALHPHLFQKRL